jgi:hypothetical protein
MRPQDFKAAEAAEDSFIAFTVYIPKLRHIVMQAK